MSKFTYADEDFPSGSRSESRRQHDLEFLSWLKTATIKDIHSSLDKRLPRWRRVALQRALRRLETTTKEGT